MLRCRHSEAESCAPWFLSQTGRAVNELHLSSHSEWQEWCRLGKTWLPSSQAFHDCSKRHRWPQVHLVQQFQLGPLSRGKLWREKSNMQGHPVPGFQCRVTARAMSFCRTCPRLKSKHWRSDLRGSTNLDCLPGCINIGFSHGGLLLTLSPNLYIRGCERKTHDAGSSISLVWTPWNLLGVRASLSWSYLRRALLPALRRCLLHCSRPAVGGTADMSQPGEAPWPTWEKHKAKIVVRADKLLQNSLSCPHPLLGRRTCDQQTGLPTGLRWSF